MHVGESSIASTHQMNENQTNSTFQTLHHSLTPNSLKLKTSAKYQSKKEVNISDVRTEGNITSPSSRLASKQLSPKSPLSYSDAWNSNTDELDSTSRKQ